MKTGKSDASNSRAILQLKALTYEGFCRIDFNETPNHNHRNVQGEPKIIKISAMLITCKVYLLLELMRFTRRRKEKLEFSEAVTKQ